jgi:hypothetical protein
LVAAHVYVFYRTPNPDNATVNDVMMELQNNNIIASQLVEWTEDHCEEVEEIASLPAAVRDVLVSNGSVGVLNILDI